MYAKGAPINHITIGEIPSAIIEPKETYLVVMKITIAAESARSPAKG